MEGKVIHILLVEDDEVDVMNVKRAFKKIVLPTLCMLQKMG